MDKKKLGAISFLAGLTIGAATALLNKQNREVVKEKVTVVKMNTSELGGKVKEKVKDTVNTIGNSVDINPKNILKPQTESEQKEVAFDEYTIKDVVSPENIEEFIPEQLDVVTDPEKEVAQGNDEVAEEEAEELLEGNGDILVK